ncbi:KR domain-containing protein [Ustulina deusta]|nr:KR domain-containing protein [Ustulina deusta]
MVLNDILFEAMTYEQWIETTRVKIQGAWNMHKLMPKDLDFFTMLSSASDYMGSSTLSNYASGNTYLDGLAQRRRFQGLAACALGLGFITDIGWAAENVTVSDEYRVDWDLIFIRSREVFSTYASSLVAATSLAQATDIIESALGAKLAMSMSMSPEDIHTSKPLNDQNRVDLEVKLPVVE